MAALAAIIPAGNTRGNADVIDHTDRVSAPMHGHQAALRKPLNTPTAPSADRINGRPAGISTADSAISKLTASKPKEPRPVKVSNMKLSATSVRLCPS